MKNRFPAKCSDCGLMVAPGRGVAVKVDGKWNVTHENCEDAENNLQDVDPFDDLTDPDEEDE